MLEHWGGGGGNISTHYWGSELCMGQNIAELLYSVQVSDRKARPVQYWMWVQLLSDELSMQTLLVLQCLHSPSTIAICMHQYLCTCQKKTSTGSHNTGCRWAAPLLYLQWLLQPYRSNVHYSDPNFLHGTSILISIPNSLIEVIQGSLKTKKQKQKNTLSHTQQHNLCVFKH